MTNTLHPPQTPRSTANGARSGVTPSFSFGLGFLPSFQFSSPMNMINSLSPQRFFQVSNNLNKVVGSKNDEREDENTKSSGPPNKSRVEKKDVFHSFTPPPSSGSTNNRFLDAIASQATKRHKAEPGGSSNDVSIDASSLNTDSSSNHNTTELTSLYMDDTSPTFVTPNTSKLKDTSLHESELKAAPKLVSLKPRPDILPENLDNLTPVSRRFSVSSSKTRKKRRISENITESPNASIASKIDIIASPSRKLSKADTSSICSTTTLNDKVWYPEIDEVLLSSYLKFKTFKELQEPNSTSLKYSSQNKILSRMILNKTGLLRTPKQIASRLFRLTKLKRPAKYRKEFGNSPMLSEELDALMDTPLDDLIDSSKVNTIDNEELEKELGSLLSSSPILTRDSNENNSIFSELKHDNINERGVYSLKPKELSIMFNDMMHKKNSHEFTRLHSIDQVTLDQSKLRSKLNKSMNKELKDSLLSKLASDGVPIWIVENNLNFHGPSPTSPNSELSPFSSAPPVTTKSKPINFENGTFSSYMKIKVNVNDDKVPDMLQWKCVAKVFNNDKLILKKNEIVNGYLNEQDRTFDLQVPFLKDFWSGYLSFLNDGHDEINELKNLSVMQIIYEDNKELNSESCVYGVIVHNFTRELYSEGKSIFTSIQMTDNSIKNIKDQEIYDDDNATEIAYSSPFKNSSPDSKLISPSTSKVCQNLKIDVAKANNANIGMGPFTAPVYNANTVQRFNPNVIKQQEQLRLLIQNHQMQQQLLSTMQPLEQIQLPVQMHTQSQKQEPTVNDNTHYGQPALLPSRSTGHIPQVANFLQSNGEDPSKVNINSQSKSQTDTSFFMQGRNDNESTKATGSFLNTPQLHQQGLVTSTPIKTHPSVPNIMINSNLNVPQALPVQVQGQNFVETPLAHQQVVVNGYPPYNTFQPELQGQYILQQYQFQQQQLQQQQMYMMYHQMQQQPQGNFAVNNSFPSHTAHSKRNKAASTEANKENSNPKEITFCPILEYDPSKDASNVQKKASSKNGIGIHRFPVNTPVTMYKPKKK